MKRRDILTLAGSGAAAAAVAASAFPKPAIAKNVIEWRMAMTWPKNSPGLSSGANLLADYIAKASDGRLAIKVYGAGEIVPPMQTMDAVANGTIQMGHGYPAYWVGQLPAVNFISPIPFGLTSQEQNAWFAYGGGQELADKAYAKLGVKFFPSGNTSVQAAGWFNKELNSIDDYKGLKVRSGGLGAKVLREAGATVVQMALGEVPQALQTNAIDGADYVGPYNDMAFGLYKVAKYYYWPGWQEPDGALDCFVNMAAWESLPNDLKEIVRGANEYVNAAVLNEFVAKNAMALHTLVTEHKVQIRTLSKETLVALGGIAGKVIQAEADKDPLSREIFESLLKFRERIQPYTLLAERDFMNARSLDYTFAKL